eukprot:jgi/Tetstr1/442132/TSEL_030286.t1
MALTRYCSPPVVRPPAVTPLAAALSRAAAPRRARPVPDQRPQAGAAGAGRRRDEVQGKLEGVVKRANGVVDGIVDLVPESVPRGTARIAVIGGGVLLVFTILQKIISTVITGRGARRGGVVLRQRQQR